MSKQAVLFFFPEWGGMHLAAWREAGAPADAVTDFEFVKEMARTAERGKFHGMFLADTLSVRHSMSPSALSRTAKGPRFEPLTLMSALSGFTERMGLLLTASTTYNEPYHVARNFASLDRISGGRAGWNVVTSGTPAESYNFSRSEHMDHGERYVRGAEFFDVVTGLWDTWDADAFTRDKESGEYFAEEKLHTLDHHGHYFDVRGPLTVDRSPQGRPVIAQAGSSEAGKDFAARVADVIYTIAPTKEAAQEFTRDIKARVAAAGRDPEHVKVLQAFICLVEPTQEEAEAHLARLDEMVDPAVGLEQLAGIIEADLSGYDLDGPVPEVPETTKGSKTRQQHFLKIAKDRSMTVRQLMQFAARVGAVPLGYRELADHIEEWVTADACDGFNVTFADVTTSLDNFVELVVPELQRRGVFHEDYAGPTLRESLGIPIPASRYAA